MKKYGRLRLAVTLWIASVCGMMVLLIASFCMYLQLNNEVRQMKQTVLMWESHMNEFAEVELLADNKEVAEGTKETEYVKDLSMSSIEDVSNENNADASVPEETGRIEEPFSQGSDTENLGNVEEEPEDITLLFAGDLLLSGAILRQYQKSDSKITGLTSEPLLERMNSADIFMVNHEFPFSDRGTAMPNKEYTFRAPVEKSVILNELGIDIVSLANNHTLDYGIDALLDTFVTLDNAGVAYVGAGENLDRAKQMETIEVGGKTIGFLGASRVIPVTNWNATDTKPGMLTTYDPTRLVAEIEANDSKCDFLVVYVHWGVEYDAYPENYQVTMAKQYIDAGADVVIGSHTHAVQGFTYYKDKLIAYGLGNFIFGNTIKQGMMLELTLGADDTLKAEIIPFYSPGFTLLEMEEENKQGFYDYLTEISFDVSIDENGLILPLQ